MKTLKNSMQELNAPIIEWESDHDSEVLQQDFVEAQLGEYGLEFSIYASRDISISHGTHFETQEVTVGDAHFDIEILAVFDQEFDDIDITDEENEMIINVIANNYE
tara:strand:- start:6108 stop:6425 length:318 start_codon:yes stop_codon:yes gene_type:complete